MERLNMPAFADKSERNDWLAANKALLITEKKSAVKEADAIPAGATVEATIDKDGVEKAVNSTVLPHDVDKIRAKLVINTTNVMDSHMDVHIPGLWKKSISEQSTFYLTQEHRLSFDKVITEEVKCYTRKIAWAELGAPYEGSTEALMFDATIGNRNEYMKGQYAKGYVKNHSVGMRYVKIYLCMNDDRYPEYKAMWDKYYSEAHNKEAVDAAGYFWAVTEAAIVEGSAVVKGSNIWTPTMSMRAEEDNGQSTKTEPSNEDTQHTGQAASKSTEPPAGTQPEASTGNTATKSITNINLY
jgi:hypothetical protein